MTSKTTKEFWEHYKQLPKDIQALAKEKYLIWKDNPAHPSIKFKLIDRDSQLYSARINMNYRALCTKKNEETYIWFFVGTHSDYDKIIDEG